MVDKKDFPIEETFNYRNYVYMITTIYLPDSYKYETLIYLKIQNGVILIYSEINFAPEKAKEKHDSLLLRMQTGKWKSIDDSDEVELDILVDRVYDGISKEIEAEKINLIVFLED